MKLKTIINNQGKFINKKKALKIVLKWITDKHKTQQTKKILHLQDLILKNSEVWLKTIKFLIIKNKCHFQTILIIFLICIIKIILIKNCKWTNHLPKIKKIIRVSITKKLLFKLAKVLTFRWGTTGQLQAVEMKKINRKKLVKIKFNIVQKKRVIQVWV